MKRPSVICMKKTSKALQMARFHRGLPALLVMFLSACGLARCVPDPVDKATLDKLYSAALPPIDAPVSVYFIGHSLIARDMPSMLAQLAGRGHRYESQLGWGAELEAHWEPDIALNGADVENDHPRFREAHDAVGSGDYHVLVLTEKVEIRSSIKWHESWHYLSEWAQKAWAANQNTRVYLYETWPNLDSDEGWLDRLDLDLKRYWEGEIIDRALAVEGVDQPIYVIPGGQVMAAFVRALDRQGSVGGVSAQQDLFKDNIHFNDLGAYLMALTHYAVIYGTSPVGLPRQLKRADGTMADSPGKDLALLMQQVVWDVVTGYPRTGVAP